MAEIVDALLLEEFVASKFECALQEVAGRSGTKPSQKGTCALGSDDLTEGSNHALVVGDRVQLNSRLYSMKQSDSQSVAPGHIVLTRQQE